ncbi:hypothetical protein C2S51_025830 [Perilla frutescens var. frutescens]|nr:hypothetical protein C2S51_025830 [Perilla frutescens var. frutescens]
MEPMYMNMHSYPNQNGQIHYRPHCFSGMDAQPSMNYGCWPWGGNYGYAPPGAYHGCCNHAFIPPHCAWGSPYSHVPPHHCAGNYPHFPVQYMPPPPYNVVEHPRYEYEKNVPVEHHCCGCSNHPLHQKEQRNVRIEEEEPEMERRKNDSLVPSQFKNSPYPIVWLPPEYKEGEKVKNTEGRKDDSRDVKVHENGKIVEQQPAFWNRWLPRDLNNVVSSKQRGDGEDNYHKNDDGKTNIQFPLYWIPYKPDDAERENHKVKDVDAKRRLESEKGSDGEHNFHVNIGNTGDQMASRVKDIPVKEAEQHVGKESSIIQEKGSGASVRDGTDNGDKKIDIVEKVSPTEDSKRKSSSPPKSSKLPPVCLRVDPLPRKKSANAKPRSPIPPGDKQKLEVKTNGASKVLSSGNEEKVKEGKEAKTIAVVDGSTSPEKSMNVKVETPGKVPAKTQDDVPTKQTEERPEEEHMAQKHTVKGQSENIVSAGGKSEEWHGDEEMETNAVKKCRELSEEEAAVIIQSAYRRFAICRWEPVKKLKQISGVREQMADVKRLIQELELSSDVQGRAKQKNIIAETIMSLLLKLDTIQGLHPSIREVRKSVVRELVSLQEKLDTVMNENPENSPGQGPMMRRDHEDASNKGEDVMSSENGNEINPADLQNQIDGGSNSESSELSKTNLIEEVAQVRIEMEAAESSVDEGVKTAEGPTTKDEDEKSNEVLKNDETSIANVDREPIIFGQGSEFSSLKDDSSARATDSAPTDHNAPQSELGELPQGVLDDLGAAECKNHTAVEADSSKADQLKQLEEALVASPIVQESHYEISNKENHETMEAHEALDLPLNGVELEMKETEIGGSLEDDKTGTEEEVDSEIGGERSEPNECRDRQLENLIADMVEPSEASDERELPMAGICIGTEATYDELHENTVITNSMMEEPQESFTAKEMPRQLLEVEEGNSEGTGLISEHANTCDAVDMVGVERTAEEEQNGGGVSEESLPQITEAKSVVDQDCNTEHPLPKQTVKKQQEWEDAAEHDENSAVQVSPAGDDIRATNQKLIEENERLRDMMEKLIKSGEDQLTAISSLSGRVKDLEKRLSRKKKLKVKQCRATR